MLATYFLGATRQGVQRRACLDVDGTGPALQLCILYGSSGIWVLCARDEHLPISERIIMNADHFISYSDYDDIGQVEATLIEITIPPHETESAWFGLTFYVDPVTNITLIITADARTEKEWYDLRVGNRFTLVPKEIK